MYKHILVAVDGSDTSNLALQEAIKLAKEQQAALHLIHVVDETPAYMMVETPYPVPTQNSESQRNPGVSPAFRVLSRDRGVLRSRLWLPGNPAGC